MDVTHSIMLTKDGVIYNVEDSEDVIDRLRTDLEYAANYLDSRQECTILETSSEDPLENTTHDTSSTSISEFDSTLDHEAIILFLDECIKLKDDLLNCKIRRKKTFSKIAEKLKKKGYNFKTAILDKKLQNLKGTYNNHKKETGRGHRMWPYMDQMSAIYADEFKIKSTHTLQSMILPSDTKAADTSRTSKRRLNEPLLPDVPSTSNSSKIESSLTEMLAIEHKKVRLGEEMLQELREIRKLKKEKLELDRERLEFEKEQLRNE